MRYIPEWFPGAKFKRMAKEWLAVTMKLRDDEYLNVKEQVVSGQTNSSFVCLIL